MRASVTPDPAWPRSGPEGCCCARSLPPASCDDVVREARSHEDGLTPARIAEDFGIHRMSSSAWRRLSGAEDGGRPGAARAGAGENRGPTKRIRPLAQEDEVPLDFAAGARNQLRPTGITGRRPGKGPLLWGTTEDVFTGPMADRSTNSRRQSRPALPVAPVLHHSVTGRGAVDGRVLQSDRGQSVPLADARPRPEPARPGRILGPRRCRRGPRRHGKLLRPPLPGHSCAAVDRHRQLDRADLPRAAWTSPSRAAGPCRVRDDDGPRGDSCGMSPGCRLLMDQSRWGRRRCDSWRAPFRTVACPWWGTGLRRSLVACPDSRPRPGGCPTCPG